MQFLTEIPDVQIGFKNDSLHFVAPDGSLSSHARLDSSSVAPIELFYSSRLEEAKQAYLDLKRAYPDFIELEDHQMSILATLTYFDLRKYPDVDATKIALNILKVGIELNEGNAPFGSFRCNSINNQAISASRIRVERTFMHEIITIFTGKIYRNSELSLSGKKMISLMRTPNEVFRFEVSKLE
jgi:hypothetical protein